ncbi:hypothetical protein CP532_1977 [Ophiocordyceps camponoti-leonardi (nom. inval.)]|nr:hypothetical protein CP532_1977 [Ophiocordyceps camponoti-leonardi (nom. inval.)]
MATSSGFGDQDKLAAARELAQTFKPSKAKGFRPAPRSAAMSFETKGSYQTVGASIPTPSQRQYAGLGKFGEPAQSNMNQKQLVGKSGLDFLRRVDSTEKPVTAKAETPAATKDSGKPAVTQASPPAATATTTPPVPHGEPRHGESLIIRAKPKNIAKGSLLETFYAVVESSENASNVGNASNIATPPKTKEDVLIDFEDEAHQVDTLASTFAKTMTLLSPTPSPASASSPSPVVDVSEEEPQMLIDVKPSVPVSDEKPKVAGLTQSVFAKKSTLCPKASDFTPRQPEPVAEAEAQPNHTRDTSIETIPARREISAPTCSATLSASAHVYQAIIPVPLVITVHPMTVYETAPSPTVSQPAEAPYQLLRPIEVAQPSRPIEVNGGLKASRWAS